MDGRIIEELGIIVSDEPYTGRAGCNNIICTGKIFQELTADIPGLIPETGIEGRLPATGLVGIIRHLDPGILQHLDHVKGCFGIQLVYKAWYE
jgi:hypothetical protein